MTTGLSELPDFLRLSYFHGQMLAACDFQREQAYFVEKLRLRNRCLHGYGVACGLLVSPIPPDDSCGTDPDPHQPRVTLHPGVAVDCLGNEIVIRRDGPVELLPLLSEQDRGAFHDGGCVYLCVEYCERAVGPTRGVYVDACGGAAECEYGWRQDSYRIRVTLTEPDNDGCADPCCDSCRESGQDPCLLLARIDDVHEGQPSLGRTRSTSEYAGRSAATGSPRSPGSTGSTAATTPSSRLRRSSAPTRKAAGCGCTSPRTCMPAA